MQLFQFRNYNVIFEPQTMMIQEFAAVRDSNKGDDDLTLKEMSFIWFFTDVRSDFQKELDDDTREARIKESISLPAKWKRSKEVNEAIKFYQDYSKTPSSGLYEASIIAAKFVENKLKNPETLLEETNVKGDKIYKLDNILGMIKNVPDVMERLHKGREQIIKELEAKTGLKGGRTKSMFEDGV